MSAERMALSEMVFPVPEALAKRAWCDEKTYVEMYERSIRDPEGFWSEQAKRIDRIEPWTKVKDVAFTGEVHIRRFEGGKLGTGADGLDGRLSTAR